MTFETSMTADGGWHTVCVEEPRAFGDGKSARESYEAARFALDALLIGQNETPRPRGAK